MVRGLFPGSSRLSGTGRYPRHGLGETIPVCRGFPLFTRPRVRWPAETRTGSFGFFRHAQTLKKAGSDRVGPLPSGSSTEASPLAHKGLTRSIGLNPFSGRFPSTATQAPLSSFGKAAPTVPVRYPGMADPAGAAGPQLLGHSWKGRSRSSGANRPRGRRLWFLA